MNESLAMLQVSRRQVLLGAAAMLFAGRSFTSAEISNVNLVPDAVNSAPDYFCTWAAQFFQATQKHPRSDLATDAGTILVQDQMNEESILGPTGLARNYYQRIRKDVFFLLDAGWMPGYAWAPGAGATLSLDDSKFPSFSGNNLRLLDLKIRELGWRGTGVWCHETPGGDADRPLAEILKKAGIAYCKIDGGDTPGFNLRRLTRNLGASTIFEHAIGEVPLNGDWRTTGRLAPHPSGTSRLALLKGTDVFRVYDTSPQLAIPTVLDRVADLLSGAQEQPAITALLNVEDEAYIAAILGCVTGIMRHPVPSRPHGEALDRMSNGPRRLKQRCDESMRAVLWHRIAPPFGAGQGYVRLDREILTDSWTFRPEDMWWKDLYGHTAHQGAPARIARNMDLPDVSSAGAKPFVAAARFPNGAVAVGTMGRATAPRGWMEPRADVTVHIADAKGPIGVFGKFQSLKLVFDAPITGWRWLAQDLLAARAVDITGQVQAAGNSLTLSGGLIDRIGLSAATNNDVSDPGLVLVKI